MGNAGELPNEPHRLVGQLYSGDYLPTYGSNSSVNGIIFELLVCEALLQSGISPIYYQAEIEFVPDVVFDIVCFHPKRPFALSCKTSLRERYKQAAGEGRALQQVYGGSESYLITLSLNEARSVQQKIESREVIGLKGCICADMPEFTDFVEYLHNYRFQMAKPVIPITSRIVL